MPGTPKNHGPFQPVVRATRAYSASQAMHQPFLFSALFCFAIIVKRFNDITSETAILFFPGKKGCKG
jgi:hypothetical protein